MKQKRRKLRNGAVALTIVMTIGLVISQKSINERVQAVDYQISVEELAVNEQKAKLEQLQKEYEEMDSLDYIKRIASNELGMVEKDAIIIKTR